MLACAFVVAGPVGTATANKKSIVAVIESYNARILKDEGHIETALAHYESSKEAAVLLAAIKTEVRDLDGMRSAIKAQQTKAPKVKKAKSEIDDGIRLIASADQNFAKAVESSSNPLEAKADAEKTVNEVKRGHQDLVSGLKLLLKS